jgi:hypothetical protein
VKRNPESKINKRLQAESRRNFKKKDEKGYPLCSRQKQWVPTPLILNADSDAGKAQ